MTVRRPDRLKGIFETPKKKVYHHNKRWKYKGRRITTDVVEIDGE